jgi:hypothetical protein
MRHGPGRLRGAVGSAPTRDRHLTAANFDIPTDLDDALEIALTCRRRRIDLGSTGDGRFVVAAGTGFDAAMLRDAHHTLNPDRPARLRLECPPHPAPAPATYRLRLDNGQELRPGAHPEGPGCAGGQPRQGAGRAADPADAVLDDGQFDIAVLKTAPWATGSGWRRGSWSVAASLAPG